MTDQDYYMEMALHEARRGVGWVNPNPLVGAVIVKDGRVLAKGWHTAFGSLHAEREALARCTEDPRGATMYVTLEPCCHQGKTPPCTQALIEAGIARVVVGASDPNPLVAGGGVAALRAAGIEVEEGVLSEECRAINEVFFHYIEAKRPFVILKYAMTLDGKIATRTGKSRWITSSEARKRVHEDRHRYAAIMVGVNTVIQDDPLLTCRLDEFASPSASGDEAAVSDGDREQDVSVDRLEELMDRELDAELLAYEQGREAPASSAASTSNPVRIICDTSLRTPLDSRVVKTASMVPTYIATAEYDPDKHMPYRERDCEIIVVPKADDHIDLEILMEKIGEIGIDSVIVEGGAELNWSVLAYEVVDKVQVYVAPKLFGGRQAPSPVGGFGVEAPRYAIPLSDPKVTFYGSDILIECGVE